MRTTRRGRRMVIGRCYVCRQPVSWIESARVWDVAVGVHRLAHREACEQELRYRTGWAGP
jgi:hypothetical protein